MKKVYENVCPQPRHGLLGVLRWKLGLGPRERAFPFPAAVDSSKRALRPNAAPVSRRSAELTLTWIGHSTFLIQMAGRNLLTDPIFGDCLPSVPLRSLRRVQPPGVFLDALPKIHGVLISHCHYDHLDARSVRELADRYSPTFWVPAGLRRWFARRGLTPCKEMDWEESERLSENLQIDCVPAQHFGARGLFDRNRTHWCGWVLRSATRSVYFAGDTAYCSLFRALGEKYGGFDLALIPIGAYKPRWLMKPVHADPEEAVQIHRDVRARLSVGCHWGTFAFTDEPLDEPPRFLHHILSRERMDPEQFLVLRPGESIRV